MEEIITAEDTRDYTAEISEAVEARIAAEERAQALEARLCCIENGVKAEYAQDVVSVAAVLFPEEDMAGAIKAAIEKYPFFAEEKNEPKPVTTGVHFPAQSRNAYSGVEAAFRKSNPNIKFN